MHVRDLGALPYRDAWSIQEQIHAEVADGADEHLLLVEHPPVITLGRRADLHHHITATPDELARLHVDVVQSDRGGDVTLHAPGQLVAYPIIRLLDHKLSVGAYVRRLEEAVTLTLADFKIESGKDPTAIGVWTPVPSLDSALSTQHSQLAKVCALGVRIRKGTTLHGLALNVTTDLSLFDLIIPCGLEGRPVTSLHQLLGPRTPTMTDVKACLTERLAERLAPGAAPIDVRTYATTPAE